MEGTSRSLLSGIANVGGWSYRVETARTIINASIHTVVLSIS